MTPKYRAIFCLRARSARLNSRPLNAGGFMQAVARPVPPGHGQSLWHGFACLQERKGRLSAGRPLLLPSLISDQGTWVPGAVSFPLLKAVLFFAGRVNKLVAEVGRGAVPDGAWWRLETSPDGARPPGGLGPLPRPAAKPPERSLQHGPLAHRALSRLTLGRCSAFIRSCA